MTDKKPKKEKPSYDIEYRRRATIDTDYNYSEWRIKFDPSKVDGMTVVRDTEKMVTFARELTATKESKGDSLEDIRKALSPELKKILKESKRLTKAEKEVGDTEDIKIADLKAGDKVNMSVRFLKLGDVKAFVRDGKAATYCKCYVEDDSGQMTMTLFDEQIELVKDAKENAWLDIKNGYVKEWRGNLELSVGKWGTLEVIYT